jgi:pimeloyl-ACP methyl ester carboxylesterase
MSIRVRAAAAAIVLSAALLTAPVAAARSAETPVPSAGAGGTGSRGAAAGEFVAPPIKWGRCKDKFLRDAGARCGMLTVPLDHADPSGATIRLAVSRVRHRSRKYRGVMFTNPGGPGGSGTYLAGFGQFVPGGVGRSYDWIGMDPRGVGESRPALTCDERAFKIGTRPKTYDPINTRTLDAWLDWSEDYAADCAASHAAELLPHLKTTDNVADFEILRQALDAKRVSFYGFSYGTYIAQVYATLHPDRINKLVLDGVVDPRNIWYAANVAQNIAFDKAMTSFFRWAARGHADLHLGRTAAAVERTYYRVSRQLAHSRIQGVGATELADVMLGPGYATFLYPEAAAALSELDNRGTARLARKAYTSLNPVVPRGDNGYAMYLATLCTDAPWPTDLGFLLADNQRLAEDYPFFTWGNAWFNGPCRTWPAAAAPAPVEVATTDQAALLINETRDAATPIDGAYEVRRRFTRAALIEGVGGTTHAGSLSGVRCVDRRIATYLASGRLPHRKAGDRSDVRCRAVPTPPPGNPDNRAQARTNPRPEVDPRPVVPVR